MESKPVSIDYWKGANGNAYTERNSSIDGRVGMFSEILEKLPVLPRSLLEVGANRGLNLDAISSLLNARLIGMEPNSQAREQMAHESLDGIAQNIPLPDNSVDMVFTCGVLIHVPPPDLIQTCNEIYRVASKYIVCIEYFADKLEEITYRGQNGLLWKQDFGKVYLDMFPELRVLGWGFFWKPMTGLDNTTYWIFQKSN